jgi:hypothetical protein
MFHYIRESHQYVNGSSSRSENISIIAKALGDAHCLTTHSDFDEPDNSQSECDRANDLDIKDYVGSKGASDQH